ncbi:MAG TPA: hypothetical protein VGA99_15025, partial [bacterium]
GAETPATVERLTNSTSREWFSSYAFAFELNQEFGAAKIAQLLSRVNGETTVGNFGDAFQEVFEVDLSEFEKRFLIENIEKKL